jgi:PAS domain S-box-containing protein
MIDHNSPVEDWPEESDPDSASTSQALRQQAEARLRNKMVRSPESIETLSPEATRQLVYELRVHQIELEMQNEELRESQEALDVIRTRYFDLYDLAPIGYCTISERGLIMQANLTAASLLGTTRSALVKQPLTRFICKEDEDSYYLYRKKLLDSGEPSSCELRMVRHDATQIWVHLAATVAHDANGALELRAVLSDITERKQLDAKMSEAGVVADTANRAKSEFLSSMSHELRTPLNAILGFAQLMESSTPPPSPSQKQSLDHILNAGWYLLALINEILDLAVVESGKLALSLESVSLAGVLLECEAMLESQAQKRGIVVSYPDLGSQCFVKADQIRLKQVLVNLLSNAIKYNRAGGSVNLHCIQTSPGRIRIDVEDTGDGLTPEQLTQLFQPFNRLGKEAGVEQGTGIGLVVSKRIVELMQGEIGVQSIVGKGSVFWIELDLVTERQPFTPGNKATVKPRGKNGAEWKPFSIPHRHKKT